MKPIKISVGELGQSSVLVNAHVFGAWGAHERINAYGNYRWTVTHVPSGMALPHFEDTNERTAIETARLLGECQVDGEHTETKLIGEWKCALEAVCAPAFLGDALPWVNP